MIRVFTQSIASAPAESQDFQYCPRAIRREAPLHIPVTRKLSQVLDREAIRLRSYRRGARGVRNGNGPRLRLYPRNRIRSPGSRRAGRAISSVTGAFLSHEKAISSLRAATVAFDTGYRHRPNIRGMQAQQEVTKARGRVGSAERRREIATRFVRRAVRSGNGTESPVARSEQLGCKSRLRSPASTSSTADLDLRGSIRATPA